MSYYWLFHVASDGPVVFILYNLQVGSRVFLIMRSICDARAKLWYFRKVQNMQHDPTFEHETSKDVQNGPTDPAE